MDSKDEVTNGRSQVVVGSGWVSIAAAGLKCLAFWLIPHLENQHNDPFSYLLLKALDLPQQLPWLNTAVLTGCGVFLVKLPSWVRMAQKTKSWVQNFRTVSKTDDLQIQLDYAQKELEYLEKVGKIAQQKRILREEGMAVPGEPDDDERIAEDFINSKWADPDQSNCRKKNPLYKHLLITAPRLLRIDPKELRMRLLECKVAIPDRYVKFMIRHPNFILNRRFWPALCYALYAHESFIESGRMFDYHLDLSIARIIRYHQLKRVEIFLFAPNLNPDMSNLPSLGPDEIRQIVQTIEEELMGSDNPGGNERSGL